MKKIIVLTPQINNLAGTELEATAVTNEINNIGFEVTLISKENLDNPFCKPMLNKGIKLLSWQSILQQHFLYNLIIIAGNLLRPKKRNPHLIVPFEKIDKWLKNKVWQTSFAKKLIRLTDGMVIVSTSFHDYHLEAANMMYKNNKPVIFNLTIIALRQTIHPLLNDCFKKASKIFLKSLNAKQMLTQQVGYGDNIELQGVYLLDEEKLQQMVRTHKPGHCRLGMLAMYRREKNFEDILHAMHILQNKNLDTQFSLVVGGYGYQDYQDELNQLIEKHQIKNVVFAGNLTGEARWDFFRTTDVYIVTSLEEGGPNAALEAMAAGIPSVASKVGAMQDWMQWDERLTYNVYDAQELASKLEVVASTLQANPNSFDYMRQLYKDLYSNQTITNQYHKVLKQVQLT